MTKKEKILLFTNIFTAVLLIVLPSFIIFNKPASKCGQERENTVAEKENTINDGKLLYASGDDAYKIYLTSDKNIKLISNDLGNEILAEKIVKTYDFYVGQSDTCEGNRWIIGEDENNKFVAVNIDSLICGNTIKKINISDEVSNLNISDISFIYQEKYFTNKYEPYLYKIFASDSNDKVVEITNIFNK